MSARAQAEYRETHVEWLGTIPRRWKVVALRHLVSCIDGVRVPLNQDQRSSRAGSIPYWGANSIVDFVDEALVDGDLILLGEDGAPFFDKTKQVAFFSREPIWPNNHIHVLRARYGCAPSFLTYSLNAVDYAAYIQGSTRDKLTQDKMNSIVLALPSLQEQSAIASFLDRETGKIDALVAEQERLIALLKEKRQAVISQAVTKGLDPNVKMKDSGVEWLGEVPAHWEVRRLKDCGRLIGGAGFPHEEQGQTDAELPFYKVADLGRSINHRSMSEPENTISRVTASALRAAIVPSGSVIYAKIGAALLLNRRRIVDRPCCIDNNMTAFSPNIMDLNTAWAWYWLSVVDFGSVSNPGAVPSISEGDQATIPLPVPPADEQELLVSYLDQSASKTWSLLADAERSVTLLRERRAALISAAVTGKIDVRDHVAEQAAA